MELVVTKLEPQKRDMFRVWINDEPAMSLPRKECESRGIFETAVLTPETIAQVHLQVLLPAAKKRCLDVLLRADQSRKMVRDKLAKDGFPEDVIELALDYAQSFHYIDDRRFALNLIEREKDKKSRKEIRARLREKGVREEDIAAAYEECPEVDPGDTIRALARKKGFSPENADRKQRDRFYQYLIRKGFSYGEITSAFSSAFSKYFPS